MIPSFNPEDNGQDPAIPAAQAMQSQLLKLFLNISGLFLKSSALVIQIAANTRAWHHFPENTGRFFSPNELLLHFSLPEERLESPRKALKSELKPSFSPASPMAVVARRWKCRISASQLPEPIDRTSVII